MIVVNTVSAIHDPQDPYQHPDHDMTLTVYDLQEGCGMGTVWECNILCEAIITWRGVLYGTDQL